MKEPPPDAQSSGGLLGPRNIAGVVTQNLGQNPAFCQRHRSGKQAPQSLRGSSEYSGDLLSPISAATAKPVAGSIVTAEEFYSGPSMPLVG